MQLKRKISLLLIAVMVIGSLSSFSDVNLEAEAASDIFGPNLLMNHSFEEWSGDTPTGWSKTATSGSMLNQVTDPEHVNEGTSSVWMQSPVSEGSATLRYNNIQIEGGKDYRISFSYKKPESPAGAYVYFKLTYRKGDNTTITPTTVEKLTLDEVSEYTVFDQYFTAPEEAVSVTYEFLMQRGGSIYIDDVYYQEVIVPNVPDAELDPISDTFDRYVPNQKSVEVLMALNGHSLEQITLEGSLLEAGKDYTVSTNRVHIGKTYLSSLSTGTYPFLFHFSGGSEQTFHLEVVDTSHTNYADTFGPNLLTNIGFEDWSGDTPIGWFKSTSGDGVLEQVTAPEHVNEGTSSVWMNSPVLGDSAVLRYNNIPVEGGKDYRVAFSYKKPESPSGAYVYFRLTYRQSDNTHIPPTTVEKLTLDEVSEYTLFDQYFTAPDGAASVAYEFLMQRGGSIYVDDVYYQEVFPYVPDAELGRASDTFDQHVFNQKHIEVPVKFNGHSLQQITIEGSPLQAERDYVVSNHQVLIGKTYLSTLSTGTHQIIFHFSGGSNQTFDLEVIDTSPANSTVSPLQIDFNQANPGPLTFTVDLEGNTLNELWYEANELTIGTDYGHDNGEITIFTDYLINMTKGTNIIRFDFDKGNDAEVAITVLDTSTLPATVMPSSLSYDLAEAQDITVNLETDGHIFQQVRYSGIAKQMSTDYLINGNELTLNKTFIQTLSEGTHEIEVIFDKGNAAILTLIVSDSRDQPQLSISHASFEKKPSDQADILLFLELNGHVLQAISRGPYILVPGMDYLQNENEVIIKRDYLLELPVGEPILTFEFTNGFDLPLEISVTDHSLRKKESNLLINPGFDTWTSNELSDWKSVLQNNGQLLQSTQNGFRLGGSAIELTAPESEDGVIVNQESLPVTPGGLYHAGFRYRTSFIEGDAKLHVTFKDGDGVPLGIMSSATLFPDEQDRFAAKAELYATAPEEAETAVFEIEVKHGKVWIDDAYFNEVPNLVVNGSFERNLFETGWNVISSPTTTGGSATRVGDGGFDLEGVVAIETTEAQDEWVVEQSPIPLLDEVRRYKVTALYQVEQMDADADSFVRLTWLDKNGQPVVPAGAEAVSEHIPLSTFEVPVLNRSGEWGSLTQVLFKPENSNNLKIELVGRGGVSKVLWDGIQIEPWLDLHKIDGSPATDISMAYDWSNEIEPDIFWSKVPEAELQSSESSIWASELIRRHFFGLDGYYYLNYYSSINNQISDSNVPYLENTIGVSAAPGSPTRVRAGDLPYNLFVRATGPNNEYYASGTHGLVGTNAMLHKLTGEQNYLDRAEELMQFSYYSQYKEDGDNEFVRNHYPDEWQRLLETGRNVMYRGGFDYSFNYNWTNVYGFTYPKHSPDGHVNSQIGARMLHLHTITEDENIIDATYELAYNQMPRNGFNYGVYKGRPYYWFGYGPSQTGIPNDASNPLGDGTDNVNAAKAHLFSKLGYLKNDKKMLEMARGLLWYLVREYEYDGAFYYDTAENPLNTSRAVLDQSHETMLVWDAMHAFAYLKEAGVDIEPEENEWIKALDTTVDTTLWYQGDRYIKALKAYDGSPEPDSEFEIVTYLQAIGEGPYQDVKWFDKLGANMERPDQMNVRISKISPPQLVENNWTVEPERDLVYEVSLGRLENEGITLPWPLIQGDIYRIAYTAKTKPTFDRTVDRMPDSGVAFYEEEEGVRKLETARAMAPPLNIDLRVNASNMLSFPADLYFPFEHAVSAKLELPTAPSGQTYDASNWSVDEIGDEVHLYFKQASPNEVNSTFTGAIYGQVSFSRFIEYDFYLPRTASAAYNVLLERINGSVTYDTFIDGVKLDQESLISTKLRSSLFDLGDLELSPGWHTIRFETPGSMSIMNVKLTALDAGTEDQSVLSWIELSGLSSEMAEGEQVDVSVTAFYTNGQETDVTSSTEFTISNPLTASIKSEGIVTAHSAGTFELQAKYSGKLVSAVVTVKGDEEDEGSINGHYYPITLPLTMTQTFSSGDTGSIKLGNEIRLSISENSVADQTTIQMIRLDSDISKTEDMKHLSTVFKIRKIAGEIKESLTLEMLYDEEKLEEGESPAIFFYNDAEGVWEKLESTIEQNKVTAEVSEFGKYAVLSVATTETTPELDDESNETSNQLKDIDGHWAKERIHEALAKMIVNGYPDGTFKPDETVSRAEFTKMLVNALKIDCSQANQLLFKDNDAIQEWAYESIACAVNAGIITGYEDYTFRPEHNISRAEMAVMIVRAFDLDLIAGELAVGRFSDDTSIPEWAKEYVSVAKTLKVIVGRDKNLFVPNGKATRAEAVVILLKTLEII